LLNYAPVNTTPVSATVAIASAATQVRIPPAFVPLLNLQPGQVVHGKVVVHNGQRTLEVKQQNLPLPSRGTLPTSATLLNEPLIFRVKVVDGQQVLTLVQASPAVKAADTGILRPLLQTAQTIQISQQQARSLGLVVASLSKPRWHRQEVALL
jgi:antitoxin component of MazEF toxin-antitoxin module